MAAASSCVLHGTGSCWLLDARCRLKARFVPLAHDRDDGFATTHGSIHAAG